MQLFYIIVQIIKVTSMDWDNIELKTKKLVYKIGCEYKNKHMDLCVCNFSI